MQAIPTGLIGEGCNSCIRLLFDAEDETRFGF